MFAPTMKETPLKSATLKDTPLAMSNVVPKWKSNTPEWQFMRNEGLNAEAELKVFPAEKVKYLE